MKATKVYCGSCMNTMLSCTHGACWKSMNVSSGRRSSANKQTILVKEVHQSILSVETNPTRAGHFVLALLPNVKLEHTGAPKWQRVHSESRTWGRIQPHSEQVRHQERERGQSRHVAGHVGVLDERNLRIRHTRHSNWM